MRGAGFRDFLDVGGKPEEEEEEEFHNAKMRIFCKCSRSLTTVLLTSSTPVPNSTERNADALAPDIIKEKKRENSLSPSHFLN